MADATLERSRQVASCAPDMSGDLGLFQKMNINGHGMLAARLTAGLREYRTTQTLSPESKKRLDCFIQVFDSLADTYLFFETLGKLGEYHEQPTEITDMMLQAAPWINEFNSCVLRDMASRMKCLQHTYDRTNIDAFIQYFNTVSSISLSLTSSPGCVVVDRMDHSMNDMFSRT